MQPQSLISNNKIILFVVFLSAAIMSSLFIFHLRQKQTPPMLAPEEGILFPVPRDIKSFDLVHLDKKFNLQDFYGHWTLLFFGFTHCTSVCPTTLDTLNRIYDPLQKKFSNLQVVLITLDPERDTPLAVQKYAQSFNPAFIGVTGKIQDIRKLQSQLGIYAAPVSNAADANYQLEHTSSILLINPQGKWAGLYKFGLAPAQFISAVQQGIQTLS